MQVHVDPLPVCRATSFTLSPTTSLRLKAWLGSLLVHLTALGGTVYLSGINRPVAITSRAGQLTIQAVSSQAVEAELWRDDQIDADISMAAPVPIDLELAKADVPELALELFQEQVALASILKDLLQTALAATKAGQTAEPNPNHQSQPPPEHHENAPSQASMGSRADSGNNNRHEARFLSNPPIEYPADAIARRLEGHVLLKLRIASTGQVATVAVAKSSGYSSLDGAAVAGVKHWQAEPAEWLGVPVATTVLLPVNFELD